jgi:hypothetical protein
MGWKIWDRSLGITTGYGLEGFNVMNRERE